MNNRAKRHSGYKAKELKLERSLSLSKMLEGLESRVLLSGDPTYHAGDLDSTFANGATPLPGTTEAYGYVSQDLLNASSTNLIYDMPEGYWGNPITIKSAYQPAADGQPAKLIVVDSVTNHLRVSRYLFDGPQSGGVSNASGQFFDPTFNGGSPLIINLGAYGTNRSETIGGVSVNPDGSIIVAGSTRGYLPNALATTAQFFDVNALVAKITPSGQMDTTFDPQGRVDNTANDGIVIYDFSVGQEEVNALLLEPGGKIVIGGSTTVDPTQQANQFFLVRFNQDGSVDNTFGQDGRTVTTVSRTPRDPRLTADGSPPFYASTAHLFDGTYGGWAARQYDDRITSLSLTSDGKIVAGGTAFIGKAVGDTDNPDQYRSTTDTVFALARYSADGVLDTTFGGFGTDIGQTVAPPGVVLTNLTRGALDGTEAQGDGEDSIEDMVIQPDGKIVAAGYSTPPVIILSNTEFWSRRGATDGAIVRYNADGSLDTTFAAGGILQTKVTVPTTTTDGTLGPSALFNSVLLQSDGKIIAGGFANTTKDGSFAITRYLPNGTIDPSFGTNGVALTRMDTTTHADQYLATIAGTTTTYTVTPNAQSASDIISDIYFVPSTGSIEAVGFSMTDALLQIITNTAPTPAKGKVGKLEFVRYKNDSPNFQNDTSAPATQFIGPTLNVSQPQYQFTVKFLDDTAMSLATFGNTNVNVTGPNGYNVAATLVKLTSDAAGANPILVDSSPVYATYQINQPAGGWINGTYNFALAANSVTDIFGNYAVAGVMGNIQVANAPDNDTPIAHLTSAPNVSLPSGAQVYDFQITYSDNFGINVATIDSTDVRVTGPNNYSQVGVFQRVDQPLNGLVRIATYRVPAPAGGWTAANIGQYTVTMLPSQVADTAFQLNDPRMSNDPNVLTTPKTHFVVGGLLGTFQVIGADTQNPTASLVAQDVSTAGGTTYQFSVTYSDDVGVNAASIATGNVTVTGPNGFSQVAQLVSVNSLANGTPRSAVYQITPPGGTWAPTNFGTYTITLNPNQVFDTSNKFVAGGVLGTFRAFLASDTANPTAIVVTAPNIIGFATTNETFTVRFSDNTAINVGSIVNGVVRVAGPGYNAQAQLVSVDSLINGTPRVATFQVNAPAGGWTAANLGTFSILMNANAVTDTSGNAVAPGQIGSFTLTTPDITIPRALLGAAGITIGAANYTFTVSYTDDVAIDPTRIGTGDVVVTGPNGYSQVAALVSVDSLTPGPNRVGTYRITPPNGVAWTAADLGTYSFTMAANRVADTSGNTVAGGPLGTATVPDTVGPTQTLTAPTLSTLGGATYQFTVTYSDPSGVNPATITSGNVKVTGPNSFNQVAVLVSVTTTASGDKVATYRINAPSGTFQPSDGGIYTVAAQAPTVKDTFSNPVTAGTLGTFTISSNLAASFTLGSSALSAAVGSTVTFSASSSGLAGVGTGNVTFLDGATTLGVVALSSGVAQFSTSSLTVGTHVITAQYAGDANYAPATQTVNQVIRLGTPAVATVVLSANPGGTVGAPITLTTAVVAAPGTDPAAGSPTGTVTFKEGNTVLATAPVSSGVATTVLNNLGTGQHIITAVYNGDANYQSAAATPVAVNVGSSNQRYVSQLYLDLLGRSPDPGGLSFWSGQLDGGQSRTVLATALLHTVEYQSTLIRSFYQQFLDRAADTNGLNYLVSLMQGGASSDSIRIMLLSSQEFFDKAGDTNAGFVTRLYTHLLGRSPDPNGLNFWTGAVAASGRAAVSTSFVTGPEYRGLTVQGWYRQYLGRSADTLGVAFWVSRLASGTTDVQAITFFVTSPEYTSTHALA